MFATDADFQIIASRAAFVDAHLDELSDAGRAALSIDRAACRRHALTFTWPRCAEVLLEVESAKATARWASWVIEQPGGDVVEAASLAKATCTVAFLRAAQENVQIHGGIGFTYEAEPHLYYRRARSSETLLGDSAYHRARMLATKGI